MPLLPYSSPPEKSTPECRSFRASCPAKVITTCASSSKIHNSREISALRAGTSHLTESLAKQRRPLTISKYLYNLILMDGLDAAFAALADPTRRAMLARLAKGEATVMELAGPFRMTQPAISQHLKVLEEAGLVAGRVEGTKRPRRLAKGGIEAMDQEHTSELQSLRHLV